MDNGLDGFNPSREVRKIPRGRKQESSNSVAFMMEKAMKRRQTPSSMGPWSGSITVAQQSPSFNRSLMKISPDPGQNNEMIIKQSQFLNLPKQDSFMSEKSNKNGQGQNLSPAQSSLHSTVMTQVSQLDSKYSGNPSLSPRIMNNINSVQCALNKISQQQDKNPQVVITSKPVLSPSTATPNILIPTDIERSIDHGMCNTEIRSATSSDNRMLEQIQLMASTDKSEAKEWQDILNQKPLRKNGKQKEFTNITPYLFPMPPGQDQKYQSDAKLIVSVKKATSPLQNKVFQMPASKDYVSQLVVNPNVVPIQPQSKGSFNKSPNRLYFPQSLLHSKLVSRLQYQNIQNQAQSNLEHQREYLSKIQKYSKGKSKDKESNHSSNSSSSRRVGTSPSYHQFNTQIKASQPSRLSSRRSMIQTKSDLDRFKEVQSRSQMKRSDHVQHRKLVNRENSNKDLVFDLKADSSHKNEWSNKSYMLSSKDFKPKSKQGSRVQTPKKDDESSSKRKMLSYLQLPDVGFQNLRYSSVQNRQSQKFKLFSNQPTPKSNIFSPQASKPVQIHSPDSHLKQKLKEKVRSLIEKQSNFYKTYKPNLKQKNEHIITSFSRRNSRENLEAVDTEKNSQASIKQVKKVNINPFKPGVDSPKRQMSFFSNGTMLNSQAVVSNETRTRLVPHRNSTEKGIQVLNETPTFIPTESDLDEMNSPQIKVLNNSAQTVVKKKPVSLVNSHRRKIEVEKQPNTKESNISEISNLVIDIAKGSALFDAFPQRSLHQSGHSSVKPKSRNSKASNQFEPLPAAFTQQNQLLCDYLVSTDKLQSSKLLQQMTPQFQKNQRLWRHDIRQKNIGAKLAESGSSESKIKEAVKPKEESALSIRTLNSGYYSKKGKRDSSLLHLVKVDTTILTSEPRQQPSQKPPPKFFRSNIELNLPPGTDQQQLLSCTQDGRTEVAKSGAFILRSDRKPGEPAFAKVKVSREKQPHIHQRRKQFDATGFNDPGTFYKTKKPLSRHRQKLHTPSKSVGSNTMFKASSFRVMREGNVNRSNQITPPFVVADFQDPITVDVRVMK